MQELDFEVGRILKTLDELALSQNTLVVFGSDNGAPLNSPGPSNAPLRDGKWTNFEGGIRTPWLMRWPGRIPAGATDARIVGIWDLLPTFCALAGAEPPRDRVIDGVNLLPVMLGKADATLSRDYVIMDDSTIRVGDWKLFLKAQKPGGNKGGERSGTAAGTLFNMKTDPGETTDVAAGNSEIVARLRSAAQAFHEELTANSRPIGRLEGYTSDKAAPEAKAKKNAK